MPLFLEGSDPLDAAPGDPYPKHVEIAPNPATMGLRGLPDTAMFQTPFGQAYVKAYLAMPQTNRAPRTDAPHPAPFDKRSTH